MDKGKNVHLVQHPIEKLGDPTDEIQFASSKTSEANKMYLTVGDSAVTLNFSPHASPSVLTEIKQMLLIG